MVLSFVWGDGMFQVGDHVVFELDGAKGVVLGVNGSLVHVMWEDYFVSWEKAELLRLDQK